MNNAKDTIKDLIVDIRFSDRKIARGLNVEEETNYRNKCHAQMSELFRNRHSVRFDRCGWPKLPAFTK